MLLRSIELRIPLRRFVRDLGSDVGLGFGADLTADVRKRERAREGATELVVVAIPCWHARSKVFVNLSQSYRGHELVDLIAQL